MRDASGQRQSSEERAIAEAVANAPKSAAIVEVPHMRFRQIARSALQIVIGFAIGLLIWQGFAMALNASGSTLGFPYPLETFERLGEYMFAGRSLYGHSIYEHLWASVQHLLIAFALAMLLGVVLGSILGYFGSIYQIGMVPVSIYQMIPGLAWLPVAILMFGLGDDSAIFIIFAVSSMVITIGVSGAIRMVPPVMVRAAKMMGAGRVRIFCQVLIPQAATGIVNALRLGMSSAWRVLIAAEMIVGTGVGLGYSIQLTRDLLDYIGAFACMTIICLVGLLIDRVILAWVERSMRQRLGFEES